MSASTVSPGRSGSTSASGLYRIQTIAQVTGFTTPLLRAWERRYGLLHPSRAPGGFRVYSGDDLRLLQQVRVLLDRGLSIGEVARMGREALLDVDDAATLAPARAFAAVGATLATEFVRAVENGNVPRAEEVVSRALHADLPRGPIVEFVHPVLEALGTAWEDGALSPGVERVATQLLRTPLESMLATANMGLGPLRVLCAPGLGDTHELGALIVALACARAGHRAIHLSGPLEAEHVTTVARLTAVPVVCLSYVQTVDARTLRSGLKALRERLPARVRVVVGGRGAMGAAQTITASGGLVLGDLDQLVALLGRTPPTNTAA